MSYPSELHPLSPFRSFFMGGFECATHRRRDRTRLDITAATQHHTHAGEDYAMLAQCGIRTVRDGLRWHLVEAVPGVYDWSSLLPLIEAANATGTQILWDLCHWGVPDHIDIFSPDFISSFKAFSVAAVDFILAHRTSSGEHSDLFCAINEISFWAWVGGDEEHFHPYAESRGPELKQQLVRASLAAIRAVRAQHPGLLFIQPEPVIHITADPDTKGYEPEDEERVAGHNASQFEAIDMLLGMDDPDLGGMPDVLDIVGVNYYWNNQWIHEGDRTPPGHEHHRPLHLMLEALWQRYGKPIVITETGAEADAAVGWLGYVAAEVRQARRLGVPVQGICLYPVMDYPGWDDERHCPCGLIEASEDFAARTLRAGLAAELLAQQQLLSQSAH